MDKNGNETLVILNEFDQQVTDEATILATVVKEMADPEVNFDKIPDSILNPVEIALSFQRLIDECKLTQEKMSERVGKKRSTITNYLRLLKLPDTILAAVRDESISMGHARALINIKNKDTQINIFEDILKNNFTVRETEQIVKDFGDSTYTKTFRKKTKTLLSFEHQKLANDISNKIGKEVKLKVSKSGKGKIEIPFNSNEDLQLILSQLDL